MDIGIFYYPLMLFIIVGTVNAVNLTDGIDGLDASVTMVAAMGFMVIASIAGFSQMNLLAAALAGGCLGFLVWNFHPAKVFMGDTGSLFLGGMVVALAFGLRRPLLLVFIGIVYVVETLLDIIQIGSVKLTGKRVFKMAPIHHRFRDVRLERGEDRRGLLRCDSGGMSDSRFVGIIRDTAKKERRRSG